VMVASTSVLLLGALLGPAAATLSVPFKKNRVPCFVTSNETVYDFTEQDIHESEEISLARYKGKVMLIFNVATY